MPQLWQARTTRWKIKLWHTHLFHKFNFFNGTAHFKLFQLEPIEGSSENGNRIKLSRNKIKKIGVQVNQRTHFLLSAMYSLILPAAICPNNYVSSVGVTLVCYQQAGSGGKYVGVSRKWVRWFTLTQKIVMSFNFL
jgi:hypothetical protein